jgi:hypothetical protein
VVSSQPRSDPVSSIDAEYTRRLLGADLEYRLSLRRDVFKVGPFHNAVAYSRLDRQTGAERLAAANSVGGAPVLIIDEFQVDASYGPIAASLFARRTTVAAWRSKPSWYAVSKLDQTISPDVERFLAAGMKATTVELDAGHLSLVSDAPEIADLILAAAAPGK